MATKPNYYAQHEELREQTNLALQKHFRAMRIFTRHVGDFYIRRVNKQAGTIYYKRIKIENPGRCDDWAVLPCTFLDDAGVTIFPIHIEIESKSGKSGLSKAQVIWKNKCEILHWLWFLNRGKEQLIIDIESELRKRGLVPWIPLNNNWYKK